MKHLTLIILLVLSACVISAVEPFDLQNEIDNAPNGGTVYIPCGIYEIGDVNIFADEVNRQWQKSVTIQGCGHGDLGQSPPLGSTQWDYLINNYPDSYILGTVLRGHITVNKGGRLFLRDVTMIGHGEGIAVDYGDNVYMFPEGGMENVSIGNYEIGVRIRKGYYMSLTDLQFAGVGTALDLQATNVMTLGGINIVACNLGADMYGEIHWMSGSVQACDEGIRINSNAAYIGGIHFEAITTTALTWSGYGGRLDPNFYASNSHGVVIDGYNNILDVGWVNNLTLTSSSQGNIVTLSGGPYTDEGWQNKIITRQP